MLFTQKMNRNADFQRLYRTGAFCSLGSALLYVRPNRLPYNRLGITAGKKIGNAVHRNRAKRLIRLAYRECEINMPVGIDIVIVARAHICEIKSDEFCAYMKKYGVSEIEKIAKKIK